MPIHLHLRAAAAYLVVACCTVLAAQSSLQRFRSQNAAMNDLQPSWMGPLIQSDARLTQAARFSVSDASAPGAQILSYGNNHGVNVIAARRFQFEFIPPSYFKNHSATLRDGFGNAAAQVKYRIASGNSENGNFAVTAILGEGFAGGAVQNGMLSSYYVPKIAAGKAFGRFNAQSTLSGLLPTSKIAEQGRAVEWNVTGQWRSSAHTWVDLEDNAAYFLGGMLDGAKQNFLTPAAFYMLRRRSWEPAHAALVFDGGMQIATSHFHIYNHNLIAELRVLF